MAAAAHLLPLLPPHLLLHQTELSDRQSNCCCCCCHCYYCSCSCCCWRHRSQASVCVCECIIWLYVSIQQQPTHIGCPSNRINSIHSGVSSQDTRHSRGLCDLQEGRLLALLGRWYEDRARARELTTFYITSLCEKLLIWYSYHKKFRCFQPSALVF